MKSSGLAFCSAAAFRARRTTARERRRRSSSPTSSGARVSKPIPAFSAGEIGLNAERATVAGVTAPSFRGLDVGVKADYFLPFSQVAKAGSIPPLPDALERANLHWLRAVGRLREGRSVEDAQAEAAVVSRRILELGAEGSKNWSLSIERAGRLNAQVRKLVTPLVTALTAIALLILVAACGNVANLVLADATVRASAFGARLALGAPRSRIARQVVTETVTLSLAGAALGLFLVFLASRLVEGMRLPVSFPAAAELTVDYRVVGFAVVMFVAAALGAGILPAIRTCRMSPAAVMRRDSGTTKLFRPLSLRNVLTGLQIAACMALLICYGHVAAAADEALKKDPGIDAENLLVASFAPELSNYSAEQSRRLFRELLSDLRGMAGVASASITSFVPLNMIGSPSSRIVAGDRPDPDGGATAATVMVAPGYFRTLGMTLLEGSDFSLAEGQDACVVNELLATELFGSAQAAGQSVLYKDRPLRIVGVVSNTSHQAVQEFKRPGILYLPILEIYDRRDSWTSPSLVVKAHAGRAGVARSVHELLRSKYGRLAVGETETMAARAEASVAITRTIADLLGLCGLGALMIALTGVYSAISFAVAQRQKEFGVRKALGASPGRMIWSVMRVALGLAAAGMTLGSFVGWGLAATTRSLFFLDGGNLGGVIAACAAGLAAITFVAALAPSWRSAYRAPVDALRTE